MLRGTVKCLLPGKERSSVTKQRPKNASLEENVRAWERECESEQDGVYREPYLPFGGG